MTQAGNSLIDFPAFFTSLSAEETLTLGERLGSMLKKGSIVALRGPLGSGKTYFTKGIARKLGINEEINSPSYTIVSEYEAALTGEIIPFYHIDAYRLRGDDDFSAIGGEEIVFGNGISVIEWSERIPAFIPTGAFRVDIEIKGDNERFIRIYRENE